MGQRAGELCHRIKIQKFTQTYDENNYSTETWVDHVTVWAKVEFLSVKDTLAAAAVQYATVARCKMRKRSDIESADRLIFDGRIFSIDGPPMPDNENGKNYITLMLSGGVEKFQDS
ncbi:phage head closure protein [Acinetobacter sp. ANC 4639]